MTREDKLRTRQARIVTDGVPVKTDQQERDALIAQLYQHPAWEALKRQLQAMAPFQVPDPVDGQFDVKAHQMMFRAQLVVQIIKAVDLAYTRSHPVVTST